MRGLVKTYNVTITVLDHPTQTSYPLEGNLDDIVETLTNPPFGDSSSMAWYDMYSRLVEKGIWRQEGNMTVIYKDRLMETKGVSPELEIKMKQYKLKKLLKDTRTYQVVHQSNRKYCKSIYNVPTD